MQIVPNPSKSAVTDNIIQTTRDEIYFSEGVEYYQRINAGSVADITDALTQPNPYEEGNTAWKDIYGTESIAASKASDGKNYYVCLDKIPVGMVYNMDLLAQADITEVPQTYSEFLACLEALQKAKAAFLRAHWVILTPYLTPRGLEELTKMQG